MMINQLLSSLYSHPRKIRISGKGLLYKVDLESEVTGLGKVLNFRTEGAIGFGPLKSSGLFQSTYVLNEGSYCLQETHSEFPQIKFMERHERINEDLHYFNHSSKTSIVEGAKADSYDPQPLLFQLVDLDSHTDVDYSDHLILGKKRRPYRFECRDGLFLMTLNGSPLFKGRTGEVVMVNIPKFKVRLEVRSV